MDIASTEPPLSHVLIIVFVNEGLCSYVDYRAFYNVIKLYLQPFHSLDVEV